MPQPTGHASVACTQQGLSKGRDKKGPGKGQKTLTRTQDMFEIGVAVHADLLKTPRRAAGVSLWTQEENG